MIALKVGPDLRMAVVASPAYLAAAESIAHPGDLLAHRCLGYRMLGSGALYAWEFERGDKALAIQVSGPFSTNEPELMLAAALDGLGVAYLPITRSPLT
jgi:DNA-binding transcriptional LysR family regulator